MQKKNCFLLGTVFKLHGYKGQVKIYNTQEIHLDFNYINYFLIDLDDTLVPFFCIKTRKIKDSIILVNFEDIDSEKKALSIINKDVYLPLEFLTETQKESLNKINFTGFQVVDINLGKLGEISYVNSKTPQKLIYVQKDGNEFCFPMHEEFINHIDKERRILTVSIPEDLINLN